MIDEDGICGVVHFFHMAPAVPLYPGAPISTQASWFACNYFATKSHLSDAATKELLDLIAIHCPETSNCAKSTYVLRNKLEAVAESEVHTFCSICFKEIKDSNLCSNDSCTKAAATLCYLTFLLFEKHLVNIFTGKNT